MITKLPIRSALLLSDSVGIFGGKPHSKDRFRNLQGKSEAGTILYPYHVDLHASTPESYLEERLCGRDGDPELHHDLSHDLTCQPVLEQSRCQRDFIISTTPPAQMGWAPLTT
ncbi:MAG: hypothetical protein HC888_03665 [Candidatus Competibacteraceae bacterium]|nr:hypothetical protein [Candidatus Competibacteraceae bacterium]